MGHQQGKLLADRGEPSRRPTPHTARPDRLPPELLNTRLFGSGNGGTRARLLRQLQRSAGNRAVQRAVTAQGGDISGPVVEDGAEPAPGQMRRTAFLAALRAEVQGVLAATDPLTQADSRAHGHAAFADLEKQDAATLTRSLQSELPGVTGSDAGRYITAAGVATRARVGGDVVAAPAGVLSRVLSGLGGLVSALFKARDGRASPADATLVRGRLGAGRPLDAEVKAPMESVYRQDFSNVRVHTDATAGAMSDHFGARAFTVGSDIAFSPGQYQPGTPEGHALIAHELAHVGQQSAGRSASPVASLEEDADRAAVGAVVSRWAGGSSEHIDGFMPQLRAGLRLQRCAGPATQVRPAGPAGTSCAALTPDQWRTAVEAAQALSGNQRATAMTQLAQQALCDVGISVQAAGTSHASAVHPDDYAEIPVINFDAGLNDKTRWRTSGRDPAPVGQNAGYNFRAGDRRFAIIGPNALNPNTWLTTRQFAQHELSLVSAPHPAGRTSDDLELQTWTEDFRSYFHQYLSLPIPQRPNWQRLVGYYDRAAPDVRQQSLRRLVDYFNNPPVSGDEADKVRRQIRSWLRRMSGTLISDLTAALPAAP
jgi:hypothetical protein